jgi:methylphosphotriester-DNA--protein-cysteine methyltransferase
VKRIVLTVKGLIGLPPDVLARARVSRDPRFDGRFFIAVKSTKIYCRPICPARTSKEANVCYFATAAAAEEAGYRSCLRCRPEAAPGSPAWAGTSAVVARALRLIQDGALDNLTVAEFAARLGIGERHLTRLFAKHVGASPNAIAQTRRLHLSKRLLDETDLPITQIALASGFRSMRRCNEVFRSTYQRAPREIRKRSRRGKRAGDSADIVLRLQHGITHLFPTAAALASADLTDLGPTLQTLRALQCLAQGVRDRQISLDHPTKESLRDLLQLPGVAAWVPEELALHGLGDIDAFPLRHIPRLSAQSLCRRAEAWRPFRGYAALYLGHAAERPQQEPVRRIRGAHVSSEPTSASARQ